LADIALINELNAIKGRLAALENIKSHEHERIGEVERVNDQLRQRIEQLEKRKK